MGALTPLIGKGTADAAGNVSIQFPAVPATWDYTGSCVCAGAPATAVFTIEDDSTPIGVSAATNTYGPFTLLAGHILTMVGTGLTPAGQYTATFTGFANPAGQGPIATPSSSASFTQITGPVTIGSIAGPVTVNGNVLNAVQKQVLATGRPLASGAPFVIPSWAVCLGISGVIDNTGGPTTNFVRFNLNNGLQDLENIDVYTPTASSNFFQERFTNIPDPSFDFIAVTNPNSSGGNFSVTAYGVAASQLRPANYDIPSVGFDLLLNNSSFTFNVSNPNWGNLLELDPALSVIVGAAGTTTLTFTENLLGNVFYEVQVPNTVNPAQLQVPAFRTPVGFTIASSLVGAVRICGAYRTPIPQIP